MLKTLKHAVLSAFPAIVRMEQSLIDLRGMVTELVRSSHSLEKAQEAPLASVEANAARPPAASNLVPNASSGATQADPAIAFSIEDRLVLKCPSPQTALDIFKGSWISRMPGEFAIYEAGATPLFDDGRIPLSVQYLGPVEGKRVLDLGPLEGGQAYVLEKMGAKSIVSVEANSILYLRCLVAKEVLGMKRASFLCGDVIEYLKGNPAEFDMCVASGILYHMSDPVDLLWQLSRHVGELLIWTHYFDEERPERNRITFAAAVRHEFQGLSYNYHRQDYGAGFTGKAYCGGTAQHSSWMTRDGIVSALSEFGFASINVIDEGDSISGPYLLLTASKK
jgi:hypothetical protein